MRFNPIPFLAGKVVRPVLRKLAGETGDQFRKEKELRRKVAVAAVAVAQARTGAVLAPAAGQDPNSVTAWQAVMRGRSIKGRGAR